MTKNLLVIQILNNIADILELQEVPFKPQAYRRAAQSVEALETLSKDIEEVYRKGELKELLGVGTHIALKIAEIIETEKLNYYEKLKKSTKIDIENLHKIPHLGPKKIKVLYQKLKIKNLSDLELAAKKKNIQKLVGFGEKTENSILLGIKNLKLTSKRFPYKKVEPIVKEIKKLFNSKDFVEKIEVAGSFRRKKSTVGDLDFLIISKSPKRVIDIFVGMPKVKEVISKGTTKSSIRLKSGLQIDLRVVKMKEFGSALLYFTGSKYHCIHLRKIALSKGYTLNEYGLFTLDNKKWVAGKTEKEIYQKLGLKYLKPEKRGN